MFTFTGFVDALLKARGHKYIKRIPYMSGGRRRYRYIYKVTHTHQGRQAFDAEHLDVGTAFALTTEAGAEFHGHITAVKGDQVTYRIDDGERKGESVTVSKSELLSQLNDVHGIESKLSAERDKLRSQIAIAREKGSAKQVRRLEERLARLGGEEKRAEPASENLFVRLKGQAKNGETTNRQGVPKKYRGAYEKIFDILEGESLGFTQVYGEESYRVDGDDMILEISPFPDADLLEKIRAIRSVEEVEQETTEPEPESEEIRAVREQVRALEAKQAGIYGDGDFDKIDEDELFEASVRVNQARRKLLDLAPNSVAPYPRTADGGLDYRAFNDDQYFKLFTDQEIYVTHLLTSDPEYNALSLKLENLPKTRQNRGEREKIESEQREIRHRVREEPLERLQGFPLQGLGEIYDHFRNDETRYKKFDRIYNLIVNPLRITQGGTKGEIERMRREAFKRAEREEDQRVATQLSNASKGDTITRQGAEYKIHKIVDHSANNFNPRIEYEMKIVGTYVDDEPAVRRAPPARSFAVLKTGEFEDMERPSERSYKYYEGDPDRDKDPNEYGEILVDHEQMENNEWRGALEEKIAMETVYPLPERLK